MTTVAVEVEEDNLLNGLSSYQILELTN
jgi:hypothetical protein